MQTWDTASDGSFRLRRADAAAHYEAIAAQASGPNCASGWDDEAWQRSHGGDTSSRALEQIAVREASKQLPLGFSKSRKCGFERPMGVFGSSPLGCATRSSARCRERTSQQRGEKAS